MAKEEQQLQQATPEGAASEKVVEKIEKVEVSPRSGLPIGPRAVVVRRDLIDRVSWICENPQCGQQFENYTPQSPLHCPYCGGPLSINGLVARGEYTPDEVEQIKKAQAARQQQLAAAQAAQAAAQAAQQAQPAVPGTRMMPRHR